MSEVWRIGVVGHLSSHLVSVKVERPNGEVLLSVLASWPIALRALADFVARAAEDAR